MYCFLASPVRSRIQTYIRVLTLNLVGPGFLSSLHRKLEGAFSFSEASFLSKRKDERDLTNEVVLSLSFWEWHAFETLENLALAAHFLPDKYHGRPKEKGLLTTYDHLTTHALDLRETEITVTQASAQSLVANLARRFESLITIYLLNFNRLLLKSWILRAFKERDQRRIQPRDFQNKKCSNRTDSLWSTLSFTLRQLGLWPQMIKWHKYLNLGLPGT